MSSTNRSLTRSLTPTKTLSERSFMRNTRQCTLSKGCVRLFDPELFDQANDEIHPSKTTEIRKDKNLIKLLYHGNVNFKSKTLKTIRCSTPINLNKNIAPARVDYDLSHKSFIYKHDSKLNNRDMKLTSQKIGSVTDYLKNLKVKSNIDAKKNIKFTK